MTRRVLATPRSLTAGGLDPVAELAPMRDAGFTLVPRPVGRVENLLAVLAEVRP